MTEKVGVVGAGSWGTTLAKIASENGHNVLLWCRGEQVCKQINETHHNGQYLPQFQLPSTIVATCDLEQVCRACRFILLVVPSHGFRDIAHDMGPMLDGEHVVTHCTKGLEQDTHKRMSEILREETPVRKIGVLTGPNLAPELAQRQPAGTLVASHFDEVFSRAHEVLHNEYFRVYGGRDVIGAEIGAAFKNVVAVAAGVVDGLRMGDNTKALLMTRGISEMAHLGMAMGAQVLTFGGMAGIGDLVATCSSSLSRNHRVGVALARGQTVEQILDEMHMVAEGVKATKAVQSYAERHGLTLPIVRAVNRVIYQGANVADAMRDLMLLDTGTEFAGLVL